MSTTTTPEMVTSTKIGTGDFVWYELRTTDFQGAIDFYTHVVGWNVKGTDNPGGIPYNLFSADAYDVAGVMELNADMLSAGMRPAWIGFVGVNDVDASADSLQQAGGKLHCPPQDIPTVGRWASVEDPQGAAFMLFKGSLKEAPPRPPMGTLGIAGWCELSANDGPSAWTFYSNLLGWQEDSLMDMGPMGVYRIFNNGGPQMGGMMTRDPKNSPVPFWLYYFNVEDIDAAVARVTEKGGQVVMGPHEVPGPMMIVLGTDPQGALFALVAPKNK